MIDGYPKKTVAFPPEKMTIALGTFQDKDHIKMLYLHQSTPTSANQSTAPASSISAVSQGSTDQWKIQLLLNQRYPFCQRQNSWRFTVAATVCQ